MIDLRASFVIYFPFETDSIRWWDGRKTRICFYEWTVIEWQCDEERCKPSNGWLFECCNPKINWKILDRLSYTITGQQHITSPDYQTQVKPQVIADRYENSQEPNKGNLFNYCSRASWKRQTIFLPCWFTNKLKLSWLQICNLWPKYNSSRNI